MNRRQFMRGIGLFSIFAPVAADRTIWQAVRPNFRTFSVGYDLAEVDSEYSCVMIPGPTYDLRSEVVTVDIDYEQWINFMADEVVRRIKNHALSPC